MGRQVPWGYKQKFLTDAKYGTAFLPSINPHNDLEDWPLAYSDYEPYYVDWERAHGLCANYNGSTNNSSSNFNYPSLINNYPLPPPPLTPVAHSLHPAAPP